MYSLLLLLPIYNEWIYYVINGKRNTIKLVQIIMKNREILANWQTICQVVSIVSNGIFI